LKVAGINVKPVKFSTKPGKLSKKMVISEASEKNARQFARKAESRVNKVVKGMEV